MTCPSCGTQNAVGAKFCIECGTGLAAGCPSCGTINAHGAKFCTECGSPLAPAADGARGEPAPSSGGGAERRVVSVLFADLVGFTPMADERDPEETRELLTGYFDAARQVIGRYGGTVEKFIGDAVMAVWGTPTTHEDDAERAVRAGLDLVEAAGALGAEIGRPELALRAAVMSGEAAVDLAATGQGMVAGDLVNTASRLQAVAPAGTVLVGEGTYRAASSAIAFEPLGGQALKGKKAPVTAYRALRVIARRSGAGRSDQLEPPFVGRAGELRLLKELFHATSDERRARLVSVMGPVGIGKSRLVWELVKYLDGITEQIFWHHGRCPAYGDGVSFWALGEMVRQRAGIAEAEAPETAGAMLETMLADFVAEESERRWILPHLQSLLALSSADGGETSREALFAAWRTLFERIAERGSVLLVFEDLQWADPGLVDFIEHVLEWSRSHPIFIVTLARPELLDRRPTWGAGQRNFTSLLLEPLAPEAMRELLTGLVPGLPPAAVSRILDRAEGVPLYAVETVRMLIADGRLEPTDGAFRPVGDLTEVAVPETLQTVVAARLDALAGEDRKLLQAASVLGKTFSVEALAAVAGADSASLGERLRGLVRGEVLAHDTDPRSPERGQFGFVQGLIREVAYGTLARRDRRRLHLAAARYFESLGDEELAGVLATHYLSAYRAQPEGPEGAAIAVQARLALRAAAERATRLASHQQALSFLGHALEVASDDRERAELHLAAGTAALWSGSADATWLHLGAAVKLYEALGDRESQLSAVARFGGARSSLADFEAALPDLEAAAEQFADLSATPAWVELAEAMSRVLMRLNRETALEWCERGLPRAEALDMPWHTLMLLITRATCLPWQGRYREANALLFGARRLAAELGEPQAEARSLINLSYINAGADLVMSYESALQGIEVAHRYGLSALFGYLLGNMADSALRIGEWDRALSEYDRVLALDLDDRLRRRISHERRLIAVLRGEAQPAEIPEVDLSDLTPGGRSALLEFQAYTAWAKGDLRRSYDEAMKAAAANPGVAFSSLTLARRAALWSGRADLVTESARVAEHEALLHGKAADAAATETEAGLAALAGRRAKAVSLFADALQRWDELRARFDRAACQVTLVRTIADGSPEVQRAAEQARAVFTELGAVPLLQYLEVPAQATPRSASPTSASRAVADEARTH